MGKIYVETVGPTGIQLEYIECDNREEAEGIEFTLLDRYKGKTVYTRICEE